MKIEGIQEKMTFCRICEASCGLVVRLEDGRIKEIEPNKNHIGTLGFSCMKGLLQHKMYDSPDRLRQPLKRVNGEFVAISWNQALQEIGQKVKAYRSHSAESIAMYVGTAAGFSILHPIFAEGFMQGIGSHNIYSSATQDCANRFASASEMYGFPFFQPFPDLKNINYLMVVGTNPVVSKWTFLQVAHPVKRLKEIKQRGGKIVVIDPRFNETARIADNYYGIQPNSDVYFFLSFLHEIFRIDAIEADIIETNMSGLAEIKKLVSEWPAEKTAELTDIDPESLRQIVAEFVSANGAAIVTGTGLGMGNQGTLAHWLAEVINAVTGNLDHKGGTLVGSGIFDFAAFAKKNNLFSRTRQSRVGGFRELNGAFPGAVLADEILTPGKDQVKALFVTGGNPLMTMANGERLKQALQELGLLVVIDIYLNETASLADYVLPSTSPLQRPDLPFVFPLFLGMQSIPYLSATDKIVEPNGSQRDEASIYFDLAEACGVSLYRQKGLQRFLKGLQLANKLTQLFNSRDNKAPVGLPQKFILDLILRLTKQGSFKGLVKQGNGRPIEGAKPGDFLGRRPLFDDHKVRLAPSALLKEAELLSEKFTAELSLKNSRQLRLISKRVHSTHNSWTQNIVELTHSQKHQTNYLYLNDSDAAERNLVDGDLVDITSETGQVRVPIKVCKDLKKGSAAMQHGWGHQHAIGLNVAKHLAGVNINILAKDGPEGVEKISGMVHLSGIPVTVSPALGELDHQSWSGLPLSEFLETRAEKQLEEI